MTMKKTGQSDQGVHIRSLTESEIKACMTEGIEEFSSFIATLHKRFASQLPHDVINNIPRGLVRFDHVS